MAQHTEQHYDDDLTGGTEKYNESLSTDFVDLFESLGDDDATIARLKTIIISLDWEITDDILQQLQNELLDLKDIWAGNKINLVYVQALEKIGRYIAAEKASAHPNAIKLLLAFYYNLEKIVSSASMSEVEKKQILLQDVKRFEQFKAQISPPSQNKGQAAPAIIAAPVIPARQAVPAQNTISSSAPGTKDPLVNLKAIVLGIDWEITDENLLRLSEEVAQLERTYSESRAKLIFLQGIGALGNYIRATKSSAHPKAFRLLHSFYAGLESICRGGFTSDKEKEVLLTEVKKFNEFKAVIAPVSSQILVPVQETQPSSTNVADDKRVEREQGGSIAPAFADMPDTVRGFRADTSLVKDEIDQGVASFLGEKPATVAPTPDSTLVATGAPQDASEISARLDNLFGDEKDEIALQASSDKALEGVEVETEADDDSDEEALPSQQGQLAPALAGAGSEQRSSYTEPIAAQPVAAAKETISAPPSVSSPSPAAAAIPGTDVESEADDDSDEAALPSSEYGELAPALAFAEQKRGFSEEDHLHATSDSGDDFDLEDRLDSFFGADEREGDKEIKDEEVARLSAESLQTPEKPVADQEKPVQQEIAEEFIAEPPPSQQQISPEGVEEPLPSENIFTEVDAAPVETALEGTDISRDIIFEPVGDDVEIDELPANWYEKITGQQVH